MKAHLTKRYVKGLQPKQKNIIVYDEEVVGFGVRIASGGTRAFILTYRIEARAEAKRLKREIDQDCDPMAERDEAREPPNVRKLIDRYIEEHAALRPPARRSASRHARTGRRYAEGQTENDRNARS
jgi:hypothetical protein